jgi:hypothetical protein
MIFSHSLLDSMPLHHREDIAGGGDMIQHSHAFNAARIASRNGNFDKTMKPIAFPEAIWDIIRGFTLYCVAKELPASANHDTVPNEHVIQQNSAEICLFDDGHQNCGN